jgi:MFS family permease
LSFLVLALAYSTRAAYSLIMPIWEQELGWSRSFTSGTVAIALLMMAVLAPIGGRLVDWQGARIVILMGLAMLALGCLLVAMTSHTWAFFWLSEVSLPLGLD